MQKLVSNHTAAREGGKVVSMQDYMGDRKAGIQEWLYQEVCRGFGSDRAEDVMKNPLLRLSMKYDVLSDKEQENMFKYTEKVMAEQRGRRIGRKNILSELLNLGNFETWDMIEEYTDRLLAGAGICKADVHMEQAVTRHMTGVEGGAL